MSGSDKVIEDEEKDSLNLVSLNDFLEPIDGDELVPIEAVQAAIDMMSYSRKNDSSDVAQKDGPSSTKSARELGRARGKVNLKAGRKSSGRNDLLGIQATTEVKERFKQVTKDYDWALGQTLQYALEALERELEQGKIPSH